jgi:hypothetical protein
MHSYVFLGVKKPIDHQAYGFNLINVNIRTGDHRLPLLVQMPEMVLVLMILQLPQSSKRLSC